MTRAARRRDNDGRVVRGTATPLPADMAPTTNTKQYPEELVRRLRRHYPDVTCALAFRTPLELLVATILSAQCTDERVNLVTKTLFRKYRSAAAYAQAPIDELKDDIRSTGFFNAKAKNIQACCQLLVERYRGRVPKSMDALVELPGIGRKTANVVLGTAFGVTSGIAVDTHVTRLSRRLGLSRHEQPDKIEQDLMAQFPTEEWTNLSHRLIHHGRRICTARKPNCPECPLNDICPKIGVAKPAGS